MKHNTYWFTKKTWKRETEVLACDDNGGVALIPVNNSKWALAFDHVEPALLGGGWMNNWDCSMYDAGRDLDDGGAWFNDALVPNNVYKENDILQKRKNTL